MLSSPGSRRASRVLFGAPPKSFLSIGSQIYRGAEVEKLRDGEDAIGPSRTGDCTRGACAPQPKHLKPWPRPAPGRHMGDDGDLHDILIFQIGISNIQLPQPQVETRNPMQMAGAYVAQPETDI